MKYLLIWVVLFPAIGLSQLSVANIFTDNMVLQRDEPIAVWGKAIAGKQVYLQFAGETKKVMPGADSGWIVYFKQQPANAIEQTMLIQSGSDKIELNHLLIGDVWLCIGQSNMEWPMQREMHYATEKNNCQRPLLRFFNPTYAGKNVFEKPFNDSVTALLTPANFYKGNWHQCDSITFGTMSAVAYYFGKQISDSMQIPVGLINLSIGGAPLETFIDPVVLQQHKQFGEKVKGDWLKNSSLPVWVRERGMQNIGSSNTVPSDSTGKNHAYKPGFAYKAGIEPLLPMHIKGVINYQGESNAQESDRVMEYAALSAVMVASYREKWNKPQLPYYFVQLSSIDTLHYKSHLWPAFRNQQRMIMEIVPFAGMAVCSDIGFRNDVHPTNKKEVGERLARWARKFSYNRDIIPAGPLPLQATYKEGKINIRFQYAGKQLETADKAALRGFSIDGIHDIPAFIEGASVVIESPVKTAFVYYGWKPFTNGNLVNSELLPASTFKIKVE